ncbi:MAG: IS630 family transposase [Fimbriimonadaceae bacterium]
MHVKETAREFIRRRAVELRQRGESAVTISYFLGASASSVSHWFEMARRGEPIHPKPPTGRPRRLSENDLARLIVLLQQGASKHGWINDLWTSQRVKELIEREFHIGFCRSHVWYVLKNYMGWTSQHPMARHRDRDEAKIARWPSVQFRRILREATQKGAYIAFVDEAGFMLMPTLRRTFSPRGVRPVVKTSEPHGRISTACAITISPVNKHAHLFAQMLPDDTNYNGHSIARFVDLLCERLDAPVVLVWDSIPIHSAKPVKSMLRRRKNLTLRMFPKYAPELNPADKVWGYIKYGRLANYTPMDLEELRESVKSEMLALKRRPKLLHSFIQRAGLDICV